jgi:hypothetical protein
MRLWTSSYRAWRPEFGAPVVASLLLPRWIPESRDWPRIIELTPRWTYFRKPDSAEQYTEQLRRYGPQRISKRLTEIAGETGEANLVILCFEIDPEQCHRWVWARYWLQATGEACDEIIPELPPGIEEFHIIQRDRRELSTQRRSLDAPWRHL